MNVAFSFQLDAKGRTAAVGDDEHVRDLIEQLLFTDPGERVNRPDFGGGLRRHVFEPNHPELAATLQFTLQAALQRWLGDVVEVERLEVTAVESTLEVHLQYRLRRTGESQSVEFQRAV